MRKINISKELLIQLYLKKHMSTTQIAKELGVNRQTITNKLKEFNIKVREPNRKKIKTKVSKPIPEYHNREKFYEVYQELKSLDLVADHFNINQKTAYLWKKKHNIPTINAFSYKGVQKINEGKPWCNKEKLEEMYSQYSSYELAIMWNCNPTTILKWLKRFNIPRRDYSEQWDLKTKAGRRLIKDGNFDYQEYKSIYSEEGRLSKVARKYIIDRVGKCQACGYSEVLDLHHINENHKDNRPENHAILCPNCHAKIHRLGLTVEKLCPNFISWDKIKED